MNVEKQQPGVEARSQRTETEPKPRHCLFIPGMNATNSGIAAELGIGPSLANAYGGVENVSVFNSIISTDKPNIERFTKMANVIKEYSETGLDIVIHSLGAAELYKVIQLLKREDPKFFKDQKRKENLHFVMIGPSGSSKGLKERITYPFRVLGGATDMQYSAMTAFPIQSISPEALTKVNSDVSNKRDDIPTIPFQNFRTNKEYLNDAEHAMLLTYDAKLQQAYEREDIKEAKRVIKARTKAIHRPLQQVFEGTTVISTEKPGRRIIGGRQGLGVILRAFGKKPMEEFMRLSDMGYQVDYLVPEFDTVKPLEKIVRLFQGRDTALRVNVIESSGHAGIGLQPDLYARAIKVSGQSH